MQDLDWEAAKQNQREILRLKKISPILTKETVWSPIFIYEVKAIANAAQNNEEEIKRIQRSLRQ